jgi:flavin reductase (DIM6/NTAB) family NADH-FMN oxidoreductase RutF
VVGAAVTSLDLSVIDQATAYKLMVSSIAPRPIAFISTRNAAGVGNLAPFSFFNGVASDPATLMFAITRNGDGSKKDTLRNIEETKQFVVNSVEENIAEAMNQASALYPYGVDEMAKVGLTPLPSLKVAPPRVAESAIHFECELYDSLEVGEGGRGSSVIIVGRILMMHFSERVLLDGKFIPEEFKPISRLGGPNYARLGKLFTLKRPTTPSAG